MYIKIQKNSKRLSGNLFITPYKNLLGLQSAYKVWMKICKDENVVILMETWDNFVAMWTQPYIRTNPIV